MSQFVKFWYMYLAQSRQSICSHTYSKDIDDIEIRQKKQQQ